MSRDAARYPAVTRTPTLRTSWQSTLCLAEQPPQATWELEEQDRIQNPLPDHLPQVQTQYEGGGFQPGQRGQNPAHRGSSQRNHSGYGAGDTACSGEQSSKTAIPGLLLPQAVGHRVSTLQMADVK